MMLVQLQCTHVYWAKETVGAHPKYCQF